MRLMLDTNIVVSALLWKGSPRRLLRLATIARVAVFTSDPLLVELAEVLSRSKFKKNVDALGVSSDRLFETYARQAEMVQPVDVPRIAPDPDDDVVIGTALAAKADFLVTGDRALLTVAKYEGVRIVSVREALHEVTAGFAPEEP
jgi:putative PIN family toxin of toxin-antitoxin system